MSSLRLELEFNFMLVLNEVVNLTVSPSMSLDIICQLRYVQVLLFNLRGRVGLLTTDVDALINSLQMTDKVP